MASQCEGEAAMRALRKLPPSRDHTQELQGDNLEHASDGKSSSEATWPGLARIDIRVCHERYGGEFQPGRDTAE